MNIKHEIVLGLLVLVSLTSSAVLADDISDLPSGKYTLDLSHASVVWKVSHMGFSTYVGRFTDFSADLKLETGNFSNNSVKVIINVDSIATEYPWLEKEDFDKELAESWFKSDKFPTISFTSSVVGGLDVNNRSAIGGDLNLMGVSKPIVLDVTINKAVIEHPFSKKPTIGFSATTTIDRTIWGVSKYAPNIVGAEVKIEIEGEFEYLE